MTAKDRPPAAAEAPDAPAELAILVPAREQVVDFYGDTIPVAQLAEGEIYVPLRPICEQLGLSWAGQRERTYRDEVLAEALRSIRMTRTEAGGHRAVLCLPLKHLPGWLFGVMAARVKPTMREKILRYRRECFDVLWRAFAPAMVPAAPPAPPADLSATAIAVENARAILHLAEQQLAMEQDLARLRDKQEVMAGYLRGFVRTTQDRLNALEIQWRAGETITEAQATELMLAVKTVAERLPSQHGQNGHEQVYGELYRRYGIARYTDLPAGQFAAVLAWLQRWDQDLA